jgi:peptidoglycan/LPS O-acetylase OafA/YrhL
MGKFFFNFESNKLNIVAPDLTNMLIIIFYIATVIITYRKSVKVLPNIMTKDQTEQLRGLSIFLVVLGHLWVHVSSIRPSIVFSNEAVALFLIISGFGLTISNSAVKLDYKEFLNKRIKRVMVPYWCVTVIIIGLDYLILSKILQTKSIIMTLIGLNFSLDLQRLDYVRWFVTFLLLWYVLFWVSRKMNRMNGLLFLFCGGIALLPLNYYFLDFGW